MMGELEVDAHQIRQVPDGVPPSVWRDEAAAARGLNKLSQEGDAGEAHPASPTWPHAPAAA